MQNNPNTSSGTKAEGISGPSGSLSDRASRYRNEVEKIVTEIGEHPLYEMKRTCSLQSLTEKIEFIKDIQSIATSRIETEKFLIIGADDSTKSFHAVQNLSEFDDATVRQVFEKYLSPIPAFEVFKLASSIGVPFILFVIPKQKTRRILARATVEDLSSPSKSKILLREGDLWTKGASTGKRLAKPEDWDEIYEETVEARVEYQTRQRTAHMLESAIAREKVQSTSRATLPSAFNDVEFKALMEEICAAQDAARFSLLLERLRDDLVEGWYQIGGYEQSSAGFALTSSALQTMKDRLGGHISNVFRPAMHWLTLAGIYVVKNCGPIAFLDSIVDLLGEVFDTSHRLIALDLFMPLGATSASTDEHLTRTVPALESLVSIYQIGGYIMKRGRLQYFRTLFRPDVYGIGPRVTDQGVKAPLVLWPFAKGGGEPEELWSRGGRIAYCVSRIQRDVSYLSIFGSEKSATEALCQLELCLELNSYLSILTEDTDESSKYISNALPNISFAFWPQLIAFSMENVRALILKLFDEITRRKTDTLKLVLLDPVLAGLWARPGSNIAFARFVGGLISDQSTMYLQNHRMSPMVYWPKEFQEALKAARKKTV